MNLLSCPLAALFAQWWTSLSFPFTFFFFFFFVMLRVLMPLYIIIPTPPLALVRWQRANVICSHHHRTERWHNGCYGSQWLARVDVKLSSCFCVYFILLLFWVLFIWCSLLPFLILALDSRWNGFSWKFLSQIIAQLRRTEFWIWAKGWEE